MLSRWQETGITEPKNLEEQGLSLVGKDVFEKLVKGYTEKQWGRDCKDLRHLSSSAFRSDLLMIITTSMTVFRESLWAVIQRLWKKMLDGIDVKTKYGLFFIYQGKSGYCREDRIYRND